MIRSKHSIHINNRLKYIRFNITTSKRLKTYDIPTSYPQHTHTHTHMVWSTSRSNIDSRVVALNVESDAEVQNSVWVCAMFVHIYHIHHCLRMELRLGVCASTSIRFWSFEKFQCIFTHDPSEEYLNFQLKVCFNFFLRDQCTLIFIFAFLVSRFLSIY